MLFTFLVLIYAHYLHLKVKEEGIKNKKRFVKIISNKLVSNEADTMMV